MTSLRLMTPEEMQASRNPAANEKTDILKTPREYGIPFLQKMYRQLYQDFFRNEFDGYPEMVNFTFSNSEDYLGRFICERKTSSAPDGSLIGFSFDDPTIDFSTSFDLSPYELANVMAHEMVHLAQAVYIANAGSDKVNNVSELDDLLGHGKCFDTIAEHVNDKLDLVVTPVCDEPTVKNHNTVNHEVEPMFFIAIPAGQNTCSLISVPDEYLDGYVKKLLDENQAMLIYFCTDANFNAQFGCTEPGKGKKSTVPVRLLNGYIASGVLMDNTDKMIDSVLDMYGTNDAEQSSTEQPSGASVLIVCEEPEVGLSQAVINQTPDLETSLQELARTDSYTIYAYGINKPDPIIKDGPADSGAISAAVRNGVLTPMYTILPNGCKMQISS